MKGENTPERIVTRAAGARFYCADCRETYQKCRCKVYRSVDTLRVGKSRNSGAARGVLKALPDETTQEKRPPAAIAARVLPALRRCRRLLVTAKVISISRETGYSFISRGAAEFESDQLPALPAKLVRQPPVRIDTLMTKEQFRKLVRHMLNDNLVSHFQQVWRDEEKEDPAQFAKAGPRKNADTHASWAWDTITGKAKVETGLGLYPKNRDNKSTWGAMDFDAHSGNDELAKGHATRAFTLLLEYRDRSVILSASGRGCHVFILANEPRPVAEWTSVLKDVAASLQLEVKDGQCELFPGENTLKNPVGKAIRVPGTYNPTTDSVEMIMADSIDSLLDSLTAEPPKIASSVPNK